MIIITKKENEKYTAISPCGSTLIGPSSLNLILFCSIVCSLSFPLDKKKCTNNVRGILQIKKTKEKKESREEEKGREEGACSESDFGRDSAYYGFIFRGDSRLRIFSSIIRFPRAIPFPYSS